MTDIPPLNEMCMSQKESQLVFPNFLCGLLLCYKISLPHSLHFFFLNVLQNLIWRSNFHTHYTCEYILLQISFIYFTGSVFRSLNSYLKQICLPALQTVCITCLCNLLSVSPTQKVKS